MSESNTVRLLAVEPIEPAGAFRMSIERRTHGAQRFDVEAYSVDWHGGGPKPAAVQQALEANAVAPPSLSSPSTTLVGAVAAVVVFEHTEHGRIQRFTGIDRIVADATWALLQAWGSRSP